MNKMQLPSILTWKRWQVLDAQAGNFSFTKRATGNIRKRLDGLSCILLIQVL
jgi:hypothetical protein